MNKLVHDPHSSRVERWKHFIESITLEYMDEFVVKIVDAPLWSPIQDDTDVRITTLPAVVIISHVYEGLWRNTTLRIPKWLVGKIILHENGEELLPILLDISLLRDYYRIREL